MKVYVYGAINTGGGDLQGNLRRFDSAVDRLRAAGHEVYDPRDNATADVLVLAEENPSAFHETAAYKKLLLLGQRQISECDAMVGLTGWQHSNGAVAEHALGKALGIRQATVDELVAEPPFELRWTGRTDCHPRKSYPGDAGYDLVVSEKTAIPYGGFADVPLGICVQLPPGTWAMLTGRSSTVRTRKLLVTQGIIDNGFRGPLYAGVQNLGPEVAWVQPGERVAQLILMPLVHPLVRRVATLEASDRGAQGFGSTGA